MATKFAKCIGFTGQGSQWVGMGKALLTAFPNTRKILEEVSSVLGYSISDIMFSGPENILKNTVNSQLGIFAYSAMILDILNNKLGESYVTSCQFLLGHSVGEFIAMYASSALSLYDCSVILKKRAELVVEACQNYDGGMSAVLFCPQDVLQGVLEQLKGCEITNINSPQQLVVSGDKSSLSQLPSLLKQDKRARRAKVKPLNVSYPFHSSILQSASQELQFFINEQVNNHTIAVKNPSIPIISNVDSHIMRTKEDLIERMGKQLASPVLWKDNIETAYSMGCKEFVEIGPKPVLSPLVKSIQRKMDISYFIVCECYVGVCVILII